MEEVNTLTEYFYYKYPEMINDVKDIVEIDTYILYIETNDNKELAWDSFKDKFIDITNSSVITEEQKRYRFRIMIIKQMKKRRLTKIAVSKRTRYRSVYNILF